jgi:hypothetical protein
MINKKPRREVRNTDPHIAELLAHFGGRELIMEILGTIKKSVRDEHYGRDPHDLCPNDPDNWEDFTPDYIAILYLRLDSNLTMYVNHASFELEDSDDEDDRRDKAVKILEAKGWDTFGKLDPTIYKTYRHKINSTKHEAGREYDSGWFNDFGFAAQNELFIYLDNPGVYLQPDDLISFKLFGNNEIPKSPNYSYFHAREVEAKYMGKLKGKMIRVENYVTKEDGELVGAHVRDYAMNIKFRVNAGTAGQVTMWIDPDTGNGAGNEP